jgi:hypothetical protein
MFRNNFISVFLLSSKNTRTSKTVSVKRNKCTSATEFTKLIYIFNTNSIENGKKDYNFRLSAGFEGLKATMESTMKIRVSWKVWNFILS